MSFVLYVLEQVDAVDEVSVRIEIFHLWPVFLVGIDKHEVLVAAEEPCLHGIAGTYEGTVVGRIRSRNLVAEPLVFIARHFHLYHHERQLLGLSASEDGIFVFRVSVETELEVGLQVLCEILRLVGVVVEESVVGIEREYYAVVHLERVSALYAVECRHVGYASCRQRVVEGAVVLVESYRIRIHSRMSAVGRIVGVESPAVFVVVEHPPVVCHPVVLTCCRVNVKHVVLHHLARCEHRCRHCSPCQYIEYLFHKCFLFTIVYILISSKFTSFTFASRS